jgi:hypothetical protein
LLLQAFEEAKKREMRQLISWEGSQKSSRRPIL